MWSYKLLTIPGVSPLTSKFNVKVCGSQALQKDTVCGRGLKVKGNVTAALSSVEMKVKEGGRTTEGRCVPVVTFTNQQQKRCFIKRCFSGHRGSLGKDECVSLTVSLTFQWSYSELCLRPSSTCITNHNLTDWQVVFIYQQPWIFLPVQVHTQTPQVRKMSDAFIYFFKKSSWLEIRLYLQACIIRTLLNNVHLQNQTTKKWEWGLSFTVPNSDW